MSNKNSCVAIFKTREEAEQAIGELSRAGIDMRQLSVVGKGYEKEEHVKGYYNAADRVKFWGKRGVFWGGLWGILFSPAFIYAPLAAPLTAGKLIFSVVANGVSTAIFAGGVTALGAALYSIGIPRNSIIRYETAVKMENYLLIYHNTRNEVERASDILGSVTDAEIAAYPA